MMMFWLNHTVDDHHWEVQLGILKMKIDTDDLEKIKVDDQPATHANVSVKRSSSSGLSTSLDLRGQTKEEALMSVDRYIDSALLAGYPSVTIIHGKGTGALLCIAECWWRWSNNCEL